MCAEYHKQYLDWISYCVEEYGLVLSNWKQIFDKCFPTNHLWNFEFFFHVILVSKTQEVLAKKRGGVVQFQLYLNYLLKINFKALLQTPWLFYCIITLR